jgi:hypothetical protein
MLLELFGTFFLNVFHALLPLDDDELNDEEESLSLLEDEESLSNEDRDIFVLNFFLLDFDLEFSETLTLFNYFFKEIKN